VPYLWVKGIDLISFKSQTPVELLPLKGLIRLWEEWNKTLCGNAASVFAYYFAPPATEGEACDVTAHRGWEGERKFNIPPQGVASSTLIGGKLARALSVILVFFISSVNQLMRGCCLWVECLRVFRAFLAAFNSGMVMCRYDKTKVNCFVFFILTLVCSKNDSKQL